MKIHARRSSGRLLLCVLMLAGLTGSPIAEVSVDPRLNDRVDTLVMVSGITDGVDPIPQIWSQYRDIPEARVLNVSGVARGDGRPDIAWLPGSLWPVAVWAYFKGAEHDVALSQWTGSAWSEPQFLTTGPEDERDPRLYVEPDGTMHVVWWVDSDDVRVELATRAAGSPTWQVPRRVTLPGLTGRRPTVAVFDKVLRVAYEHALGAAETEIRVLRLGANDVFEPEWSVAAGWPGPLEPILHVRQQHLWLDWLDSPTELGHVELTGDTTADPQLDPCQDPSWVGVESLRRAIEDEIVCGAPGGSEGP